MKGSNDKTIMMWDVKGKLSLDTDLAPSLSAFRDKLSGSSFDSVCGPVSLPYLFLFCPLKNQVCSLLFALAAGCDSAGGWS